MESIAEALVKIAETEEKVYEAGYLNGYVAGENSASIEIDATLTQEGAAADAKAVGEKLGAVESTISTMSQKLETVEENATSVGKTSETGGELFNNYSNNIASGNYSHAEGNNTKAKGDHSHAEGDTTKATGAASHAEGWYTIASGDYQHVQGKFNISDKTSAFIIGNGNNENDRSNAMTVDWDGNAKFAGDVTTGSGNSINGLTTRIGDIDTALDNIISIQESYLIPNGDEVSY